MKMNYTVRRGVEAVFRKVAFDLETDMLTSQMWDDGDTEEISGVIDLNIKRLLEAKVVITSQ